MKCLPEILDFPLEKTHYTVFNTFIWRKIGGLQFPSPHSAYVSVYVCTGVCMSCAYSVCMVVFYHNRKLPIREIKLDRVLSELEIDQKQVRYQLRIYIHRHLLMCVRM